VTQTIQAGNIPTARFGPVIAELIRDRWPHGGGYDVLAEKVGCDRDAIDGIVRQTYPGVGFDLADRLLCGVGRYDMWHGVLEDIYPTKFMATCAIHSCNVQFPESSKSGRPKIYCSPACCRLAYKIRQGEAPGHRHVKRNRCFRGHKLEGDNLMVNRTADGKEKRQCRECKRVVARAAARRYDERHPERVKQARANYRAKQREKRMKDNRDPKVVGEKLLNLRQALPAAPLSIVADASELAAPDYKDKA
jgi:hypothetical protein